MDTDTIYTVGHSNRDLDTFLAVLEDADVERLADIRTYPNSRRFPWFSKGNLEDSLAERGIEYEHLPSLGGLRDDPGDIDLALPEKWHSYAFYMQSDDFAAGLEVLDDSGREDVTAIMCAERDPNRCHRHLVADALVALGWKVVHLIRPGESFQHELRDEARIVDDEVSYSSRQESLPLHE